MTVTRAGLDPDRMRVSLLASVEEWEAAKPGSGTEQEASERFTAFFAMLDAHLRDGGQLPAVWLAGLISQDASTKELRDAYADITLPGRVPPAGPADWHRVLRLAFTTIARLRIELDKYQGRDVHFATEAHCVAIVAGSTSVSAPSAGEFAVLRASDTGREWEMRDGRWRDR
jgi:hypothetical protein